MLILTRKTNETIIVNNNIKFIVLGVKGNQVRIGVEAPEKIEIHRQEIWEKIQQEKISAINNAKSA